MEASVGHQLPDGKWEVVDAETMLREMEQRTDAIAGDMSLLVSPHVFLDCHWGEDWHRMWDADGALHLRRLYPLAAEPGVPRLSVYEVPFAPNLHICTGGVVWPAAFALARFLYECRTTPWLCESECVVEIGAGCGVPGFCAAALTTRSDCRVFLTDENVGVLANLRRAARLNAEKVAAQIHVSPFSWEGYLSGSTAAPVEQVDLVLGSDVIWGERGPIVFRVARRLLKPGGALVLSAEVGRHGFELFEACLRSNVEEDNQDEEDVEGEGVQEKEEEDKEDKQQGYNSDKWQGGVFDVDAVHVEAQGKNCIIYVCKRCRAE